MLIGLSVIIMTACGVVDPTPESFSVAGTVTGLRAGNSVVLDLNGEEDLVVSLNGGFLFSTKVQDGSQYNVTVQQQPTGQTATIGSGLGVIAGAPVTGVSVTISTNTYSVGGTLTGLPTGESITLTLNGTQTLIVSANGDFSFDEEIPYGVAYVVASSAVPDGYMLNIENGNGVMAAGDVTTITVSCVEESFAVGGIVAGLSGGETVSLSLNGGENLVVSANGAFTFPQRLSGGTVYTVTVPAAPAAKTVISENTTGLITGSDVDDVSITVASALNDISTPTTLSPGASYLVPNGEEILVNSELNIYSGTTIVFGSGASMRVNSGGFLNAQGTAEAPILFTADNKSPGRWNGLVFYDSNNSANLLDHVIIEYAGGQELYYADARANLAVTAFYELCKLTITNAVLRHSAGYGLYTDPGITISGYSANTCTQNASGAI